MPLVWFVFLFSWLEGVPRTVVSGSSGFPVSVSVVLILLQKPFGSAPLRSIEIQRYSAFDFASRFF
jgi:hypothetical protein